MLAAILALNFPWLLGFTSFLLGCCLFPITLGVWWAGRDRLESRRLVGLAVAPGPGLLLSSGEPGTDRGWPRVSGPFRPAQSEPGTGGVPACSAWDARRLPCLPLVVLGVVYLRISRQGGPMQPLWENLERPVLDPGLGTRLGWVDPLTLARKDVLPFTDTESSAVLHLCPCWLACRGGAVPAGGDAAGLSSIAKRSVEPTCSRLDSENRIEMTSRECRRARQAWLGLGLFLLLAGLAGPDSLGIWPRRLSAPAARAPRPGRAGVGHRFRGRHADRAGWPGPVFLSRACCRR